MVCDGETIIFEKENGSIVISKDDHGDCLLIASEVHLAYGGHFLQKAPVTSPKYCPFA